MASHPESTGTNPTVERTVRLVRPSLVVLCGPAACGKSTFAARHFRPTQIISSDHARALLCDNERDQRHSAEAFGLVNFIIEQRLSINRLCVVDSTALTPEARKTLLDLARKHGVTCVVFLFDIPLETCIARDGARQRSLGRAVIERQYRIFVRERDNLEREGFDQIITLPANDLDKVRIDVLFRPIPRPSRPTERAQPGHAPPQSGRPPERDQRRYRRGPASPNPTSPEWESPEKTR
jgi:predicted kinase